MAEVTEVEPLVAATNSAVAVALGAGGVGVALGFAGGYLIARRRLETKYTKQAEAEIQEMREHFAAKEVARQEKRSAEEIVREQGYDRAVPDVATPIEVLQEEQTELPPPPPESIFSPPEWDYAVENKRRTEMKPTEPYILHKDEFEAREDEFEQLCLTYYGGDDVLAGPDDGVLPDHDVIVGMENLNKFGYGSEDRNVLYIRNVALGVEYEVTYSPGRYDVEVLGETPT